MNQTAPITTSRLENRSTLRVYSTQLSIFASKEEGEGKKKKQVITFLLYYGDSDRLCEF